MAELATVVLKVCKRQSGPVPDSSVFPSDDYFIIFCKSGLIYAQNVTTVNRGST